MKTIASRTKKITQTKPAIVRMLPRPPAPAPQCQEVADGLGRLKDEALHGLHVGALVMVIHPDGSSTWDAYGTLGKHDDATTMASSQLTVAVYKHCRRE